MTRCLFVLGFISTACFAKGLYDKPTSEDPDNFTMTKVGSLHFQPQKSTSRLTMNHGRLSLDGGSEVACRIENGFKGSMSSNYTGFYEFNQKGCHILVTIDPAVVDDKITYSSTVRFAPASGSASCLSYCDSDDTDIQRLESVYK